MFIFLAMAISSLIIFEGGVVSAVDFSFISPANVAVGQEFSVTISAPTQDVQDVKIFVYKETKNNYVSQILYGGTWRNPHRYLGGAFPQQTTFFIRVSSFSGETEICARLRRAGTNSSSFNEQCNAIRLGSVEAPHNSSNEEQSNETRNENSSHSDKEKNTTNLVDTHEKEIVIQPIRRGKIVLNKPQDKPESEFVSREDKVRMWIVYGFTGLCVLLIILLAFNKL